MMRGVPVVPSRRRASTVRALALWLSVALPPTAAACARQARVETEAPVAAGAAPVLPAAAAAAAATSATPERAAAALPDAGNLLVSEAEYQGWRYYHVHCARCHNQDALGSIDAPDLRASLSARGGVSADSFMVIVRKGADNKEMPPFHEVLDDAQIRAVYAYVKARSDGRLAAGRPRRRTASTTP